MPDYGAYGYDPSTTGSYQTVGTLFAGDSATGSYAFVQQTHPQQAQQSAGYRQETQARSYDQDATGSYAYGYGYGTAYATPSPYGEGQSDGYGTDFTAMTAGYDGYGQQHPYGQRQPHPQAQPEQHTYGGTTATAAADPAWDTGGYAVYDPYDPYATGSYDATGTYSGFPAAVTAEPQPQTQARVRAQPQARTQAQTQPQVQSPVSDQQAPRQDWDSGTYPAYGYGYASGFGYDASGDTGVYEYMLPVPGGDGPAPEPGSTGRTAVFAATASEDEPVRHDYAEDAPESPGGPEGTAGAEPAARSRRRKPAKRSALLTVAVPSVAVMGVAAVGAAAVAGVGMADSPSTRADAGTGKAPTTQLDRTLTGVSRDADDFAARANRSQQRVDLKQRQAAAKKAAQEAAARKEALRPKFVLPVKQKGVSAYFGEAGVHWMARHTGIDFPVFPGTPVMAVTDGTVRTQWNASYGNMAIVTAADGTETWYCHLSSTKIRSGKVKAGTVIAYSGNTGNTTGPHLHFEVRPGGGEPIDPLPWLLAHGLDPR
jgi:murein DD-endopeptidase MepM/ murein hydrolase activator NlpD